MFRPLPSLCLLTLAAVALTFTGCKNQIYKDVYSPKRSRFVPTPEKREAAPVEMPTATEVTMPTPVAPPTVAPEPPPAPAPMAVDMAIPPLP